jgi:GPH family glycoside/pentoside/hexuronide:cation symporter
MKGYENSSIMNNEKLTFKEKLSYGMGDSAGTVAVTLSSVYLTAYYTDTVGLGVAAVGTMMFVARIFDGATDLVMGAAVDKTKSKWGKARPWLLWTAPFMALAIILMFNVPTGLSDNKKLIYAYMTYIFQACIVYTANNLPYNALLSRMTLDVKDRGSAASVRMIMTQVTSMIVTSLTAILLGSIGWFGLSIFYGGIMIIMLFISFWGVKEHIDENEDGIVKVKNAPLKEAMPALLKNKYFYLQCLSFCVLFTGAVSAGSMTFYYCNIVLNDLSVLSIISIATALPIIILNLIMPKFIGKFGKRKLMIGGFLITILGSILISAAGTNVILALGGVVIKAIGTAPIMTGIFAMTSDIVDYGEWKTGIRSEGLVNSCTSFGMKVGIGLGSVVCTWYLALGGYQATAEVHSKSVINMISFGYGYSGAIFALAGLILCLLMNIDKDIATIQRDLQAKHV